MSSEPTTGRRTVPPPPKRRTRRSLGDEIRDAVYADFIATGATPAGDRLPTEAELCDRYGVSRVTVRAALRSLQESGLIVIRQGHGSTVLPQSDTIASGLDRLCSFETFARDSGRAVTSAELDISEVEVTGEAASRLGVEPGSRAMLVQRIKLYGGAPVGWIVDYVPVDVLSPKALLREFDGSVLDVLLGHDELEVEYSDCDVVPVVLDREMARRLDAKPGAAALYLDEQTCTRNGRIVNWSQAWLLPEHLRFCLRRRKQYSGS